MTNKEIFIKAINKAEKNGWECSFDYIDEDDIELENMTFELFNEEYFNRYSVIEIIHNHSFAKAFWGEDKVTIAIEPETTYGNVPRFKCKHWEYQLQRIVLEEDIYKYIEKFL